jgi:MFS family permease
MAVRFLLGITEAGFGPGVPYLLSFFYRRRELGVRIGLFLACAPLASTFAGALAYGITSGHSKLANWRLLFLVEGIPTILSVPLVWFFLPDSPATAKFLTEEEKQVARARGMRRSGEEVQSRGVDWKDIGLTLLDAKAWLTAVSCPSLVPSERHYPTYHFLPVDVLQLQRQLRLIASLSSDYLEGHGLHSYQRTGSQRAAVLSLFSGDYFLHVGSGSITAAWLDYYSPFLYRSYWLRAYRCFHFCRSPLLRSFPRSRWYLSLDREYPTLGFE